MQRQWRLFKHCLESLEGVKNRTDSAGSARHVYVQPWWRTGLLSTGALPSRSLQSFKAVCGHSQLQMPEPIPRYFRSK